MAVSMDTGMTELRASFLSNVLTPVPFVFCVSTFGKTSLVFVAIPESFWPGSVDIARRYVKVSSEVCARSEHVCLPGLLGF